jgi:hypothetical protein
MKWQHLFLACSIFLIILGLVRSIKYETLVGTNGSGYQIGFELSGILVFGLMGLALYFANRRRSRREGSDI